MNLDLTRARTQLVQDAAKVRTGLKMREPPPAPPQPQVPPEQPPPPVGNCPGTGRVFRDALAQEAGLGSQDSLQVPDPAASRKLKQEMGDARNKEESQAAINAANVARVKVKQRPPRSSPSQNESVRPVVASRNGLSLPASGPASHSAVLSDTTPGERVCTRRTHTHHGRIRRVPVAAHVINRGPGGCFLGDKNPRNATSGGLLSVFKETP